MIQRSRTQFRVAASESFHRNNDVSGPVTNRETTPARRNGRIQQREASVQCRVAAREAPPAAGKLSLPLVEEEVPATCEKAPELPKYAAPEFPRRLPSQLQVRTVAFFLLRLEVVEIELTLERTVCAQLSLICSRIDKTSAFILQVCLLDP